MLKIKEIKGKIMLINTFIGNSNDEHMKKQLLLLVMFATSLLHAQVYFPPIKALKQLRIRLWHSPMQKFM